MNSNNIGILWAQYGPYHFARAEAVARLAFPAPVHAIEIASRTRDYNWTRSAPNIELITLFPGAVTEELSFLTVFRKARQQFQALKLTACLLPSYSPRQSLAALLAAKSLGSRAIMMNETHAGTVRSGRFGTAIKRRLISLFDAALLGGQPQKRYFESLGMPPRQIFTGYDTVDNDYFAQKADMVRKIAPETGKQYGLPEHYFLSLGRFVPKKNIAILIRAFHKLLNSNSDSHSHLVLVGSGEEETALRSLCQDLRLPTYNKSSAGKENATTNSRGEPPGVHFYGFRQIDENPVFYALADAFILPSLREEWGLVVNEAMASGLPVAVSENAGCAEDLLETGCPESTSSDDRARILQSGLALKARRNGFMFSPHSADELSRVLQVFEGSARLRASMGAESRRIVGRFSCENFAQNALLAAQAAFQKKPLGLVAPVSSPFHADAGSRQP